MSSPSTAAPAILHIGVGSFHRAHQAWYLHRVNEASPAAERWSLVVGDIRDDLRASREALAAQANAEAEREALARELDTLEPSVDKLKGQIADMRARRNDLNARSNILQAKQEIAQAKDVAATALGGIGGKNLSEDFQKLEDKVALSNARSDARLNSADTNSGRALDDKLAALNKGPSVAARLEALKKQLNTPAQ